MKFIGKILKNFYTNLRTLDFFDIMLAIIMAGLSVAFLCLLCGLAFAIIEELGAFGIFLSLSFIVFFIFFVNKM